MKKLKKTLTKKTSFAFPSEIKDKAGNVTHFETSNGSWRESEYDSEDTNVPEPFTEEEQKRFSEELKDFEVSPEDTKKPENHAVKDYNENEKVEKEIYSGYLLSNIEIQLVCVSENEWAVDVRKRAEHEDDADPCLDGYSFGDSYKEALALYKKAVAYYTFHDFKNTDDLRENTLTN